MLFNLFCCVWLFNFQVFIFFVYIQNCTKYDKFCCQWMCCQFFVDVFLLREQTLLLEVNFPISRCPTAHLNCGSYPGSWYLTIISHVLQCNTRYLTLVMLHCSFFIFLRSLLYYYPWHQAPRSCNVLLFPFLALTLISLFIPDCRFAKQQQILRGQRLDLVKISYFYWSP